MFMEKVLTGSVVAAPYQEGYHRVKVISVVKDIIGVNYFNIGTVGVVRKDQLRLARNVQSFAQSASECCLWGVQGAGGERQHVSGGLWPS